MKTYEEAIDRIASMAWHDYARGGITDLGIEARLISWIYDVSESEVYQDIVKRRRERSAPKKTKV